MRATPEPARPSSLRRRFGAARARAAAKPTHAIECARCGSAFLVIATSERVDDGHWRLLQRCGSCETWQEVVVANTQAALLQIRAESQQAAMAAALVRAERERMAADIEAFSVALRRDLISAADFAR